MTEDIIDRLRAKEEEMEALIQDAKRRASAIKEEALKKAKELKEHRIKETEEEVKRLFANEMYRIKEEAGSIEKEAEAEAAALREKGMKRMGRAVDEVMRLIWKT